MKKQFHLAGVRTLFPSLTGVLIILGSCSDKVDKTLDKMEDIVTKYEEKAEEKKFTAADRDEMYKELQELDKDFRLNVGKPVENWTDEQRARSARLEARMDQMKETNRTR